VTAIDVNTLGIAPVRAAPRAGHVAAVAAGNALEFYDFLTYAFFAAQIGRSFFPNTDAGASLLASLATFGAGFLMRPVGALVIGRIGDRAGRKPAMLLSFSLMGMAMTGLALTPPAHMIGVWAPVLAVLFRLVQGFALGGEVGSSTAFLVEAAPPHRRGFYVSLQYLGQDASILVSGLVGYALSSQISAAALDAWGWRLAFLVGASIVPFGLILRRGLAETLHAPAETDPDASVSPGAAPALPFAALVVLSLVILAGGTTVSYVMDYLTTFATETLHMAVSVGFLAPIVLGACGVIMDPIGGLLSDRYGRKPVMLAPWSLLLIVTVPAFTLLIRHPSGLMLVGLTLLLSLNAAIAGASVLTAVTEGLPRRIRCGALGLIYAFAISIFGGSTQFNVALISRLTHSPLAPAWYMTAGVAISLVAMLFLRESAPARLGRTRA
jgi:MFS transporter, MHS family, citrate/tricarballylate:H+ symporter